MTTENVYKVLHASSQVNPKDDYEALILGGIVRSVIDTGHFSPDFVKTYVPDGLGIKSVKQPSNEQIAAMAKRFMHFYNPPKDLAGV